MEATLRWHRCPDCDVQWQGADDECWLCGRMVHGSLEGGPRITSTAGFGTAMSSRQWDTVRREIGVDP